MNGAEPQNISFKKKDLKMKILLQSTSEKIWKNASLNKY